MDYLRRYCFIYNPASDQHRSYSKFNHLKSELNSWDTAEIIISKKKGDIVNLAKEAAKNHKVIVACGGDGTLQQVSQGLLNTDSILGIVPMGSGNDFAKSLHIPPSISKALKIIKNEHIRRIDIGKCNDFYFLNTLGFGFDGQSNTIATELKWFRGQVRYLIAVVKAALNINQFRVSLKSGHLAIDNTFIMVTIANGRVEGGIFLVAPEADPGDGKLDLLLVKPVSMWKLPLMIYHFTTGNLDRISSAMHYQSADEINLSFNKTVKLHADGEVIESNRSQFTIQVIPDALKVISG